VESLLFDAFIPAAYRNNPAGRWKARDAERWFVFLARHLEYTIVGSDLAWWQLPQAIPGLIRAVGAVAGVIAGIVLGVLMGTGDTSSAPGGPIAVVVIAVVAGIVPAVYIMIQAARRKPSPVRGFRWHPPSRITVTLGLGTVVVGGAGFGIGFIFGSRSKVAITVAIVAILAAFAGVLMTVGAWLSDQEIVPLDLSSAESPPAALAADRRTGTAVGVTFQSRWALHSGV